MNIIVDEKDVYSIQEHNKLHSEMLQYRDEASACKDLLYELIGEMKFLVQHDFTKEEMVEELDRTLKFHKNGYADRLNLTILKEYEGIK